MAVIKTSGGHVVATSGGRVSVGNCGTGAGGFQPGNTCATGGAGGGDSGSLPVGAEVSWKRGKKTIDGQVLEVVPAGEAQKPPEPEPETLPARTADTMSDAIAMSSPNGRISKRAHEAATKELAKKLFGDVTSLKGSGKDMRPLAEQWTEKAVHLRGLANLASPSQAKTLIAEAEEISQALADPVAAYVIQGPKKRTSIVGHSRLSRRANP